MARKDQLIYIVAGGLLEKDGKFLLVNARIGVPKGLWNIPAGHVDEGETIEESAAREVKEETGFDAKARGIVGVYHKVGRMIRVNFKMEITGGELSPPEDEIAEARWFTLDEIKAMDDSRFAFGVKTCILDYAERGMMRQGLFSTRKDVR